MTDTREPVDPLTQATMTVVWVIIANKPFYPVYVWWLVGTGVATSAATLISLPFFLAIPLIHRRSNFAARLALPLVGTVDTVFETIIFGQASATLLFLAPCMALAALSFEASEKWPQRGVICFIFGCFVVGWFLIDGAGFSWSAAELATLRTSTSLRLRVCLDLSVFVIPGCRGHEVFVRFGLNVKKPRWLSRSGLLVILSGRSGCGGRI
ncbi:hypothetical protein [Pararhizobium capsulatum]|uniref:hypothetical protein n=1 Tax=Pararhizobium capsulatum TaxID=34014 RepID=UPI0027D7D8A5|nr:hypothetical protein [Pararhizobium capsulatum]